MDRGDAAHEAREKPAVMSLTPEGVERLPTFGNVVLLTSLEWASR
jgi:hypothetical protein